MHTQVPTSTCVHTNIHGHRCTAIVQLFRHRGFRIIEESYALSSECRVSGSLASDWLLLISVQCVLRCVQHKSQVSSCTFFIIVCIRHSEKDVARMGLSMKKESPRTVFSV